MAEAYLKRADAYRALKDYDKAWANVRKGRQLGVEPDDELLGQLIAESGRSE